MSLIIVDADSIIFKAAIVASSNSEIRKNIKEVIKEISRECFMGEMRLAIKGKGNFRYDVYKDYKSNRKPLEDKVRERINYGHKHLREEYGAVMADGMEADDLCAIWCWECIQSETPYVLAHIDKDLDQIPGSHYNYNKKTHYLVQPEEGYRFLCKQWVMGDSTDGIPGISGMGPKKTDKFLEGVPSDRLDVLIRKLYKENGHSEEYCDQMLAMVYMLQNWDEYYAYYPDEKPEEESNETDEASLQTETNLSEQDVLQSEEQDEGVSGVSGGDPDATDDGEQGQLGVAL